LSDSVQCPKCSESVPLGKMVAEMEELRVHDHKVNFVVRRFSCACPKCGPFFYDRVGHHGTISVVEMSKLFPKAKRKGIKNALSEAERELFRLTVEGKREPKEGEIERWLTLRSPSKRGEVYRES